MWKKLNTGINVAQRVKKWKNRAVNKATVPNAISNIKKDYQNKLIHTRATVNWDSIFVPGYEAI